MRTKYKVQVLLLCLLFAVITIGYHIIKDRVEQEERALYVIHYQNEPSSGKVYTNLTFGETYISSGKIVRQAVIWDESSPEVYLEIKKIGKNQFERIIHNNSEVRIGLLGSKIYKKTEEGWVLVQSEYGAVFDAMPIFQPKTEKHMDWNSSLPPGRYMYCLHLCDDENEWKNWWYTTCEFVISK